MNDGVAMHQSVVVGVMSSPMCSCLVAALFKVFSEVVTSCFCCLQAWKLRYFWPQRFKNTSGGQTLAA